MKLKPVRPQTRARGHGGAEQQKVQGKGMAPQNGLQGEGRRKAPQPAAGASCGDHPAITMCTIPILLPDNPLFQQVTTSIKVDRVKYSVKIRHLNTLRGFLGPRIDHYRTKVDGQSGTYYIFIDVYDLGGHQIQLVKRQRNDFWFQVVVDDPTEHIESCLWELFNRLPPEDAMLSEMEVALDLRPEDPKDIWLLKRLVLAHLWLPHARVGARPYPVEEQGLFATWYSGSKRGGPRGSKVYHKPFERGKLPRFLRIEWTIHRNFATYGIDPRDMTRLDRLRWEKLVIFKRFDRHKAAELAYYRDSGRPMNFHRRHDQCLDVTLALYGRCIEAELNPNQGPGHVEVLAQQMERYKKLPWACPQDLATVFPSLQ